MKEWQIEEVERIKRDDTKSEEQKAHIIRLISMSEEERRAYGARRNEFKRSLSYTITLTGEEVEQLQFAAQLNRRMLDRSPEHATINEGFKIVEQKCGEILEAAWRKEIA